MLPWCHVVYFFLSVTVQLTHLLYSTGYMRPECMIHGLCSPFVHSVSCMNTFLGQYCAHFMLPGEGYLLVLETFNCSSNRQGKLPLKMTS